MKIAITQRIDFIKSRNEYRDSIDQRLVKLLIDLGHHPILVSNILFKSRREEPFYKWLSKIKPEGIILSGGNNIYEYKNRDETEIYLYKWATSKKLPILGICRGMQMIGVINGVKLKKIKNHVNQYHYVINKKNKKYLKNSFHDYSLISCPNGFEVMSKSVDNQIESIKHKKEKIIGIMWHPEREKKLSLDDSKILNIFNG